MNRPRASLLERVGGLFSLPLFACELVQQAARPQTYMLRTGYAALLFVVFQLWAIRELGFKGTFGQLGEGRPLLDLLVNLQFFGVYLFMPVLTCGVISHERERRTFDLVLLTRIGLTRILLEKLLSRLVPMATLFLLMLPLLAFALSLGGVEARELGLAVWFLSLTALQVGCLSLIYSARCRHTATALLITWVTELLLFGSWAWHWLDAGGNGSLEDYQFFPPALYELTVVDPGVNALYAGLPTLGASLFCFLVARIVLELHALPSEVAALCWPNSRWLRFAPSSRPTDDLPDDRPLLWLEQRRSIPTQRTRQFLWVAEAVLIVVCIAICIQENRLLVSSQFAVLMGCMWGFVVLAVTVKGTSLFATERSRQTLDVLLSTPLAARTIVLQKFAGVYAWVCFLSVPFLTVMLPNATAQEAANADFPMSAYILCSLLSFAIYLPLFAWVSCWIGAHAKNPVRAILVSLAVLFAWCVLPLGVAEFSALIVLVLSPLSMLLLNETWGSTAGAAPGSEFVPVILNALFYGYWLFAIRQMCLRDAHVALGRLNERERPRPIAGVR